LLTLERGERVGGVAPMVSNIYNEQRSPFPLYDVNLWGSRRKGRNDFLTPFPVQSLAFPCVGFGRRVLGEVGILDERFPLGFFADEDFSLRIIQAGYKLYCDPRVYVFHIGSASIEGEKNWIQFYRSARALFEKKWGIPYKPKRYRLFHPYR
jgi:GT2 family glycosyltransferase